MVAFAGTSPYIKKNFSDRLMQDKKAEDPAFYPFWYAGYEIRSGSVHESRVEILER